ncbi:MAG: hypothetical protein P8Y51_08800, partial [Campylobacterales bacterium]
MIRPVPFLLAFLMLLLAGCSTKEYYKPESTVDDWPKCEDADFELVSKGAQGAVADTGEVVDQGGIASFKIPSGQRYLGRSGGWALYTGLDGNVTLKSVEGNATKVLPLQKTVAAATVKDDFLAVLFASNDLGIYRLSTGKSYYKLQGSPATAVDVRIARPYFLGNLVIFPTLDGRFVVVDYEHKELLRSTVVSTEPYFDNLFYFNVIGDTMVAATQQRLFSLSDKERRQKYDLRNVVFDKEGIWIATKEGEVLHLTPSLQPAVRLCRLARLQEQHGF